MQPDFPQIGPFLVAALVVFAVYRRLRRSFGRQLLRPARTMVRIALLMAVACALLPMAFGSSEFLTAELLGAALGMSLALWGARRTRFLMSGGRLHYVPHTYAGIAVSLLFLGRLAFRLVQGYTGMHAPSAATRIANAAHPSLAFGPGMVKSPLTVGILFVLVGYYVCFYSWVLWKSKHLESADVESDSAPLTQ